MKGESLFREINEALLVLKPDDARQCRLIAALQRLQDLQGVELLITAAFRQTDGTDTPVTTELETVNDWIDNIVLYDTRSSLAGYFIYYAHCITKQGQSICFDTFTSDKRL